MAAGAKWAIKKVGGILIVIKIGTALESGHLITPFVESYFQHRDRDTTGPLLLSLVEIYQLLNIVNTNLQTQLRSTLDFFR